MLLTVSEAKEMMIHDRKQILKKLNLMENYLSNNPNDEKAIKKINSLRMTLCNIDEYIEHYSHVEKMIPDRGQRAWG